MIGLTLACTVAILGASAKASVDKSVEENFVGDYVVSNVFGEEFSPAITDQMADVDGVGQVLRQRFRFGLIDGDEDDGLGVAATAPDTIGDFDLTTDVRQRRRLRVTAPCCWSRTGRRTTT